LRISLTRDQSTQILLSRYPMQQGAVARASEHFAEARSKLAQIPVRQREVAGEVKRLEEAMSAEENLQQPKAFEDRINPVKSELEVTGDTEQQLGAEPDTLSTLETQLDDSVPSTGNPVEIRSIRSQSSQSALTGKRRRGMSSAASKLRSQASRRFPSLPVRAMLLLCNSAAAAPPSSLLFVRMVPSTTQPCAI
jgi:hypothetical protein